MHHLQYWMKERSKWANTKIINYWEIDWGTSRARYATIMSFVFAHPDKHLHEYRRRFYPRNDSRRVASRRAISPLYQWKPVDQWKLGVCRYPLPRTFFCFFSSISPIVVSSYRMQERESCSRDPHDRSTPVDRTTLYPTLRTRVH